MRNPPWSPGQIIGRFDVEIPDFLRELANTRMAGKRPEFAVVLTNANDLALSWQLSGFQAIVVPPGDRHHFGTLHGLDVWTYVDLSQFRRYAQNWGPRLVEARPKSLTMISIDRTKTPPAFAWERVM